MCTNMAVLFIYLFGVLRRFQHCTGHITTGSWKGRGNQYTQFVRVLYCKLPTDGKQLPALPLEAMMGIEPRTQRWEAIVLPLCHRGPWQFYLTYCYKTLQMEENMGIKAYNFFRFWYVSDILTLPSILCVVKWHVSRSCQGISEKCFCY